MEDALSTLIKTIGDGILEHVKNGLAEMELRKPEPDNTTFTVDEAAEYIRTCKETIYRLTRSGEIPAFKVGSRWYIYKRELDRWIEAGGST